MDGNREDDGQEIFFGDWLKRWRVARGLSQEEVGERAGVLQDEVSKYERHILRRPGYKRVQGFAVALSRPLEDAAMAAVGVDPDAHNTKPEQVSPQVRRLLGAGIEPVEAEMLWDCLVVLRGWSLENPGKMKMPRLPQDGRHLRVVRDTGEG